MLLSVVFHHCWGGTLSAMSLVAMDVSPRARSRPLAWCLLPSFSLFRFEVSLFLIVVALRVVLERNAGWGSGGAIGPIRNGLVLGAFLLFLTPILQSLTAAYSDDTILFLSMVCLMLHLLTQDYAYINNYRERFSGMASLNLAIFATVMLASRLETNALVFAFVLFAMELFAALPLVGHHLRQNCEELVPKYTACLCFTAIVSLNFVSKVSSIGFGIFALAITFVCPLWLKYLQRYKAIIHGGWDEAIPGVRVRRQRKKT